MTSVNGPSGERDQCPTTTRSPATVPSPAMQPSNRSMAVASLRGVCRRADGGPVDDPAVWREGAQWRRVGRRGVQQRAGLATPALRRVLVVLCITEIVSWGVLYYAFPVLAPAMSHDTGWSPEALTAGFSIALGISALVGVPVGRWLDRRGPRAVMTAGSVLAVPAVVVVATAQSLVVYLAGWVLAGIAAGGVLYPPAFAALTRWWAPRQVVALTALTTIAGLSSTVFAPLTAALLGPLGWRGAYLVLAGILALVTIPLHLWGLRGPWPRVVTTRDDADPTPVVRSRPFLLLGAALALATLSAYAVLVNLVPLLLGRGLDTPTAALALGLGGVGQVVGRLGYRRLAAVTTPARAGDAGVRDQRGDDGAACAGARARRGAGRTRDPGGSGAWDLHVAAGHGRRRPVGDGALRPAQRDPRGPVDGGDGGRAVRGDGAGRGARRLSGGVRAAGRAGGGLGGAGAGRLPAVHLVAGADRDCGPGRDVERLRPGGRPAP
jgi:MFS family permease